MLEEQEDEWLEHEESLLVRCWDGQEFDLLSEPESGPRPFDVLRS
jgi:hypothetical protein